jgi:hypothetical protein
MILPKRSHGGVDWLSVAEVAFFILALVVVVALTAASIVIS